MKKKSLIWCYLPVVGLLREEVVVNLVLSSRGGVVA